MKRKAGIQVTLVIFISLLISSLGYYLVCKGLKLAKSHAIGKFNYILSDSTYYDQVFFGSSSIQGGINPALLDSISGIKTFNAAMDGLAITEVNMMVHKFIASHGKPKRILLGLDPSTLDSNHGIWYFPQYYPYIDDKDMVNLVKMEPKLLLGKYLPFFAITYIDDPLKNLALIGLLKDRKKKEYDIVRGGSRPTLTRKITASKNKSELVFSESDYGWNLLGKTISEAKEGGIEVKLVLPPRFNCYIPDSEKVFFKNLKLLEKRYNVTVYDYTTDKRFASGSLFYDQNHLNIQGASYFTKILATELISD